MQRNMFDFRDEKSKLRKSIFVIPYEKCLIFYDAAIFILVCTEFATGTGPIFALIGILYVIKVFKHA